MKGHLNQEPTSTGEKNDGRSDACCTTMHAHDLSRSAVEHDVRLLSALANDTRYEALRLLAATDGELCTCEFEEPLGVSQSTVSQALSALYAAGLVTRRKEGRWRYYGETTRAQTLLNAMDTLREPDHE